MLSRFNCVRLFDPWTVIYQAPLSMGFSRQEYWSGCYALLQGIFLTQKLNPYLPSLLHWQVYSLSLSNQGSSPVFPTTVLNKVVVLVTQLCRTLWGPTNC